MSVVHPGLGLGEGGVELRVTTVRREMFALAEGEDGVFQRAGAVEAPAVLGDGLGEVGFGAPSGSRSSRMASRARFWRAQRFRCALVEGLLVFRGVDDDLAGDAVAEGVERGTLFAFGGTGPGGKVGVFAAGVELCFSHERLLYGNHVCGQVVGAVGEMGAFEGERLQCSLCRRFSIMKA
jgi:hypothetical protein